MTQYDSTFFDMKRLVAAISKRTNCGELSFQEPLNPVYLKTDPFESRIVATRQQQEVTDFSVRHDYTVGARLTFTDRSGVASVTRNDGYLVFQKGFERGRAFEALQCRVLTPVRSLTGVTYSGIDEKMIQLFDDRGKPMFYRWSHRLVGSTARFLPHGWARVQKEDIGIADADFLRTDYAYYRSRNAPVRVRDGILSTFADMFGRR